MADYKPLDNPTDSTAYKRREIIQLLITALQPYAHLKTLMRFNQDQDLNHKTRKDFTRYTNIPSNNTWSISLYPNYFTVNYIPRLTTGTQHSYTDTSGKIHTLMWLDIDHSKRLDEPIVIYTSTPVASPCEVIASCQEYLERNNTEPTHDILSLYNLERWIEGQFNDRELTETQYKTLRTSVIKTLDKYKALLIDTKFKADWPW